MPQSIEVLGGLDLRELGKVTFKDLQFEVAARYRDEVAELKKELRGMQEAGTA